MVNTKSIMGRLLGVALLCTACSTYDLGGMMAAGSSVQDRFDASMTAPDCYSHPATILLPEKSYRFLVATDFHLQDQPDWDRLGRFLSQTDAESFGVGVFLGDYMYEAGHSLLRFRDSLNRADHTVFLTAIGNHEVYKNGYQENYRPVFGATCYAFRVEGEGYSDLFIVLDSANGTLGIRQYDWLESILTDVRPGVRHCFICTHANFFSPPGYVDVVSTYPIDEMMKLLDLFAEHRVTAVFTGHSHVRDETVLKEVSYVTVGSWGGEKREWCQVECRADGTWTMDFRQAN